MLTLLFRNLAFWTLITMPVLLYAPSSQVVGADTIDVWIVTSLQKPSKGIYHCTLNTNSGKLTDPQLAAEIGGPGFLAMHPDGHHLYAVGSVEGKPSVAAYGIEKQAGKSSLQFDNLLEIGDGGAAHVAVDPTGRTLLTAQYGGGSVAAFSLSEDGSLNEKTVLIEHEGGSGVVAGRQLAPHAHRVGFLPNNRFAFAPDLGLDKVMIYEHDPATSMIKPHGFGKVPAGGGPRHMKFHNNENGFTSSMNCPSVSRCLTTIPSRARWRPSRRYRQFRKRCWQRSSSRVRPKFMCILADASSIPPIAVTTRSPRFVSTRTPGNWP